MQLKLKLGKLWKIIFQVKVLKVNTMNYEGKLKREGVIAKDEDLIGKRQS